MLNKKREQKAKLELSGKPDRGNTAGVEVVEVYLLHASYESGLMFYYLEFWMIGYLLMVLILFFQWQAKVERGQEEFDAISQMIKKEMERFEINRVKDFKQTIINYLENLMLHQQQVCNLSGRTFGIQNCVSWCSQG